MAWRTFQEFEQHVTQLASENARGDAFEAFVRAYLCLTPELALEAVWPLREVPTDILRTLGLPQRDIGVDFVARRRDGAVWVIQAKFRSDRASVRWRELSTFVGASGRAAFRLLVSNSVELPRNKPVLEEQHFGTVLLGDLVSLDADFFERWERFTAERRPIPPTRKTPRPDQQEAIEAVTSGFWRERSACNWLRRAAPERR